MDKKQNTIGVTCWDVRDREDMKTLEQRVPLGRCVFPTQHDLYSWWRWRENNVRRLSFINRASESLSTWTLEETWPCCFCCWGLTCLLTRSSTSLQLSFSRASKNKSTGRMIPDTLLSCQSCNCFLLPYLIVSYVQLIAVEVNTQQILRSIQEARAVSAWKSLPTIERKIYLAQWWTGMAWAAARKITSSTVVC